MTETLAYRYSSESTQQELSNEYQHDRVKINFSGIITFTKKNCKKGSGSLVHLPPSPSKSNTFPIYMHYYT